jgi:putative ABC transport system ATP-binding protein
MTEPDNGAPISATAVLAGGLRAVPNLGVGLGLTSVLAVIATSGRVVVPIAIQQIIDRGLQSDQIDMGYIRTVIVFAAVALVVTALTSSLMHIRLAVTLETALSVLRVKAFAQIHRLSPLQRAEERRGNLVSRVTSDVDEMSKFMAWAGLNLFTSTIQFVVASIVMLAYSWRLALVVFAVFTPFVWLARRFQRQLVQVHYLVRQRLGAVFTAISEMLAGAAVLRTSGTRKMMQDRIDAAIEDHRATAVTAGRLTATFSGLGEVFAASATMAVVVVGVLMGGGETVTAGTLIAFLFLITLFVEPVVLAAEVVNEGQTAIAGLRRVLDVLHDEPALVDPGDAGLILPAGPLSLTLNDVSFRYPNATRDALSHVTLSLQAGERVAIVGETGSGKSTFVKLAARFADPSAGSIMLSGVAVDQIAFSTLRRRVVFLPQEDTLFGASVADNVRVARQDATDTDVTQAFDTLGLSAFIAGLPAGIHTLVGERGASLSAGERQLVALARAALADPDLLILDESTSALDPATDAALAVAVTRLIANRTALIVAHRLATAEKADRIVVFANGTLAETGTHATLVHAGGLYETMHSTWLAGQA